MPLKPTFGKHIRTPAGSSPEAVHIIRLGHVGTLLLTYYVLVGIYYGVVSSIHFQQVTDNF